METKSIVIVIAVVLGILTLIPIAARLKRQGQEDASGQSQQGGGQEAEGEISGPLRYGDGWADGKKSLGGSGEMIQFTLPASKAKVAAIRIHGARYGTPAPPAENFQVSFLSGDMSRVVHQEGAPYSLFDRGEGRWVEVRFRQPVEVPKTFWVVLDFKAGRTKGVYVSYDTSTGGQHSRTGLPGQRGQPVSFGGDWMIEAILSR